MKLNLRQLLLKYNILFLQVCTIFTLRGGEASMFFFFWNLSRVHPTYCPVVVEIGSAWGREWIDTRTPRIPVESITFFKL